MASVAALPDLQIFDLRERPFNLVWLRAVSSQELQLSLGGKPYGNRPWGAIAVAD